MQSPLTNLPKKDSHIPSRRLHHSGHSPPSASTWATKMRPSKNTIHFLSHSNLSGHNITHPQAGNLHLPLLSEQIACQHLQYSSPLCHSSRSSFSLDLFNNPLCESRVRSVSCEGSFFYRMLCLGLWVYDCRRNICFYCACAISCWSHSCGFEREEIGWRLDWGMIFIFLLQSISLLCFF